MVLSAKKKIALGVGVVFVIFMVVTYVNWFVYPFVSAKPNYADVEKVFNKLQIPPDWVEISRSENKGIAGRQCPIESDGCFSKGKRYQLNPGVEKSGILEILRSSGCISPTYTETVVVGGSNTASYECTSGGVRVSGSLIKKDVRWEASVYAGSR